LFHQALGAAAYPLAGAFIENLWEFAWRVYEEKHGGEVTEEHMKEIQKEHEAILDAIRGRDEHKAVRAVKKHFREIRRRAKVRRPWTSLSPELHDQFAVAVVAALVGSAAMLIAVGMLLEAVGVLVVASVTFLLYLR